MEKERSRMFMGVGRTNTMERVWNINCEEWPAGLRLGAWRTMEGDKYVLLGFGLQDNRDKEGDAGQRSWYACRSSSAPCTAFHQADGLHLEPHSIVATRSNLTGILLPKPSASSILSISIHSSISESLRPETSQQERQQTDLHSTVNSNHFVMAS